MGAPNPRSDGLLHCVEGGLYPYHALGPEFRRTGAPLPPLAELGWCAPAGLVRYRGDAFGPESCGARTFSILLAWSLPRGWRSRSAAPSARQSRATSSGDDCEHC